MTKKALIIAVAAISVCTLAGGLVYGSIRKDNMSSTNNGQTRASRQSHTTYSLNLTSGKSYLAMQPEMIHFSIQDQDGKTLKDFDSVHDKKLHLIVVRKDRTNFQHVHPTFDPSSGMFTIKPFTFPTDGEYRVFADFTASNSQMGPDGIKLAATPYRDVQVGDVNKYTAETLGEDKLNSSVSGFDTNLFLPGGDSTGKGYIAGTTLNLAVSINKNGQAYKNLQTYLSALGHMVVLSPNLEYIHAHATSQDVANQVGLVTFAVVFPDAGQYKLYLQTQADNQVNTTDYTVTVKPHPGGIGSDNQSMQGMDHNGH